MKHFLLPLLITLSLPAAIKAETSENTFQLICTTKKYFSSRSKSWKESDDKFILLFETSKGIATKRSADTEKFLTFGDSVYKIKETTRNTFKLYFFQPKNTYFRNIRIDRLTGDYTFFSGFLEENVEKGWDWTYQHKGNCIKTSVQDQLF